MLRRLASKPAACPWTQINRTMLSTIVPSRRRIFRLAEFAVAWGILTAAPALARAQAGVVPSDTGRRGAATDLAALLARADSVNPAIGAAAARVAAAQARISPAGSLPDPNLMAGIVNLPLNSLSFTDDDMTMKMVGIEQMIPFPGKLRLRRRIAVSEAAVAEFTLDSVRLSVARQVKEAYYDLAFLDRALELTRANQRVLSAFASATGTRYASGTGGQEDVIKAQVELSRLAETANALIEQRQSALAALNALLGRDGGTPVDSPAIPAQIAVAAVPDDAARITFLGTSLGATAAGSPLPPLRETQDRAARASPVLRALRQRISTQSERIALAASEIKPDFDLSLQYGQRSNRASAPRGRPDMITALVSIPLRIHKSSVQGQQIAETRADLAAMQAEDRDAENGIRAKVARLYSEADRARTQLAIYRKAVLPQGRVLLGSALGSYQSGKADFLTVLDAQNTISASELVYYQAVTDFAKALAALDETVGEEVLP